MLPFILTSFREAVCSLPIGGFLRPMIHLVPSLLAVYCPEKASAHTLPSQRVGFAVAACWFCCRSFLRSTMQADAPSLSAFSICRGRTFLLSSRSVPFPQESSFRLLFGSPALPTIPHWFIFVMFCLLQTDILPLFSLGFCFFFPAHCINRIGKLPFCPQMALLRAEKCLFRYVLSLQIMFWGSSSFLKCT